VTGPEQTDTNDTPTTDTGASSATPTTTTPTTEHQPRWGAFALVCLAYLAATVGEQVLSPVFPEASDDLGLTKASGGIAFGVLAFSIAVANLVGGMLLRRVGSSGMIGLAAAISAVGSVLAAVAPGFGLLVVAQVFLGVGAGFFFPAGLQAVAILAGPNRKGFAMGIYGVAFSAGLTVAALLGTIGATTDWRLSFWISAGLSLAAVVASFGVRITPAPVAAGTPRVRIGEIMGLPTAVGSVGAISQYGAIPFLTTFAVVEWDLSKAGAAALLAVGRVISILAKLISGAGADRVGPRASARTTGMVLVGTGLAWVLLPGGWITYALAAIFAGTVSSLFPVANVLAVERFGQNGTALGAYRSVQIGIGAAAGALIGLIGDAVGLRPVLVVAVVSPLSLLWLCREPRPEPR
jgi:predicted MFS family arabinose efflux permease